MIILTVFLMLLSIYSLILGSPFFDTCKGLSQASLDAHDGKPTDVTIGLKGCGMAIVGLFMAILNLYFLATAFAIDPLKYPTLMVLLWNIVPAFYTFIKSKFNHDSDECKYAKNLVNFHKMSRWTFRGVVGSFGKVAYYGYIMWILMGGVL